MTTLFVADIHLSKLRPELSSGFIEFLNTTAQACQSLYLLGDIFEAWIGDDYNDPDLQNVFNALKQLSAKGVKLYFQHGNRDFLVGQAFAKMIGATLLDEVIMVDVAQTRALVMHGDQLCTDDTQYQSFRSLVRSTQWQQEFLSKTIEQRLFIAEQLRSASKEQGQLKSQDITDVNQEAVINTMQQHDVNLLIHGHTHRPAVHNVLVNKQNATRMVLGDWGKSLWYIKCSACGCELIESPLRSD
jgi:UDP-2,3-diacylglucosamine hydrolase